MHREVLIITDILSKSNDRYRFTDGSGRIYFAHISNSSLFYKKLFENSKILTTLVDKKSRHFITLGYVNTYDWLWLLRLEVQLSAEYMI